MEAGKGLQRTMNRLILPSRSLILPSRPLTVPTLLPGGGLVMPADWIRQTPFIEKAGLTFKNLIQLAKSFWFHYDEEGAMVFEELDKDGSIGPIFDEQCCCDVPCIVCPNWWPFAYGNGGVTADLEMPDFGRFLNCGGEPDECPGPGNDGSPLTGFYHLPFSHTEFFLGCVFRCVWVCDFFAQGIGVDGEIELPSYETDPGCNGSSYAQELTFFVEIDLCTETPAWAAAFYPTITPGGCVYPEFCFGGTAWPSQFHDNQASGPCDTDCFEYYDDSWTHTCGPPTRTVLSRELNLSLGDGDCTDPPNLPCSWQVPPAPTCAPVRIDYYEGAVTIAADDS